ncbi:hypothetical protein FRB99_007254 [Tulasnella sp. 403]|nr:hypothetical protein FRB99_007254 [Tulasnella sp. 403]
MGAQGSRQPQDGDTQASDGVVDYYTLLEVSEDATQDEIRNPNDVEAATQKFAALQQAYEERAWYDSHRSSLAPEPDAEAVFEDIRKGAPPPTSKRKSTDPGLQAKHLLRFMDASIWKAMDDSDYASRPFLSYRYHGIILTRRTLLLIFQPQTFGYSHWTWGTNAGPKEDSGAQEAVRNFYNAWLSFATAKDFIWKELWNLSEAPNRQVRKGMEGENKKARNDARRDYNDTVRALVKFIRKRDPRYQAHLVRQVSAQQQARSGSGAQALQRAQNNNSSRAAAAEQFVEQAWQQTDSARLDEDDEWADPAALQNRGDDDEDAEYECVVCQKSFKSERAWTNHEQSRKHIKEVELLKRRMRKENQELGLDDGDVEDDAAEDIGAAESVPASPPSDDHGLPRSQAQKSPAVGVDQSEGDPDTFDVTPPPRKKRGKKARGLHTATRREDEDQRGDDTLPVVDRPVVRHDYISQDQVPVGEGPGEDGEHDGASTGEPFLYFISEMFAYRNAGTPAVTALQEDPHSEGVATTSTPGAVGNDGASPAPELSKREKRRAREAAKKAKETEQSSVQAEEVCNVCLEQFASRTKLFAHIKETGHALAEPAEASKKKTKSGPGTTKKPGAGKSKK